MSRLATWHCRFFQWSLPRLRGFVVSSTVIHQCLLSHLVVLQTSEAHQFSSSSWNQSPSPKQEPCLCWTPFYNLCLMWLWCDCYQQHSSCYRHLLAMPRLPCLSQSSNGCLLSPRPRPTRPWYGEPRQRHLWKNNVITYQRNDSSVTVAR